MAWRARIWRSLASSVAGVALVMTMASWAAAKEAGGAAVLELVNGDFVRGTLASVQESLVRWQGDSFTETLAFPLPAVRGMRLAPRPQAPQGDFLIELNNQDLLFGKLLSIDDVVVRVETPQLGTVSLRRDAVRRLARNQQDLQVHRVPDRLEQWVASDIEHWRSQNRSLATQKVAAYLYAEDALPPRAAAEVELSWTGTPNFAFFLGTDQDQESRNHAFSIEVWGEQIVAQRRNADQADLAVLQKADAKSLHIYAYLDQPANRLTIYGADGTRLADLQVAPEVHPPPSGIMLLNRGGNVRLQHLQVRSWSGIRPRGEATTVVTIQTKGATYEVESLQLAPDQRTLSLSSAPEALALDDVQVVDFPTANRKRKAEFVATYQDGSRISGKLLAATNRELLVRSHASDEPWRLSLELLRAFTLAASSHEVPLVEPPENHRPGTLEMMDTRLQGWLVEQQPTPSDQAGCLVWRSSVAQAPSPLRKNSYGRIVYREAAPVVKRPTAPRANVGPAGIWQRLGLARQKPSNQPRLANSAVGAAAVHLRSGDAIPCKILGIDQQGVHIDSSLTESRLIPHERVKAAQLADNARVPVIEKTKRTRLLTLPRMQRHAPPLHLLFSPQGDILRGTVRSLTEEQLELEIRLNPRRVPRSRVATIVWLHEDEIEQQAERDSEDVPPEPTEAAQMLVQVVSAGNRFSFAAEEFADQTIHGTSDVLQRVHANVQEIDQLLIGGFIHRAARTLPYHRWRLLAAPDPKFVQLAEEGTSSESIPGTSSRLVGNPAPDIRLKMLDGGKDFQMADHRGQCVVLDFWATWCGHCLQIMPEVEQVVAEFPSDHVRLVSVNLEERPELIRAVLDRRGVEVPVALDRDGVAALRYEAAAIPQTVVVGPDGNVARVFVGTTPNFAEHLRAALTELLAGNAHDAAGP